VPPDELGAVEAMLVPPVAAVWPPLPLEPPARSELPFDEQPTTSAPAASSIA
jgi:hypothetical protein